MASPPFDIAQAAPADNDFVSPYPAVERTFRDVVESWLLVEGNVNGRSNKRAFDFQSPAPDGVASVSTVYADDLGYLMIKRGAGSAMYLEEAPGTVKDFAGASAPVGWLVADGSAVSRTTYARLFALLSTTYGIGDGTTTFNLPDLKGRVTAGVDGASARLSVGYFGVSPASVGAVGGAESNTLTTAKLPAHTHTQAAHNHKLLAAVVGLSAGAALTAINFIKQALSIGTSDAYTLQGDPTTPTVGLSSDATPVIDNTGGGEAHANVQPTIILNKIIKY